MSPFDPTDVVRCPCPRCGQQGITQGVRAEPGRVMLLRRCPHCAHDWETERIDVVRGVSGLRPEDRRNGNWSHAHRVTVQPSHHGAEEPD